MREEDGHGLCRWKIDDGEVSLWNWVELVMGCLILQVWLELAKHRRYGDELMVKL